MLGSRDPNAVGRHHAIEVATNLPCGPDFPVPVRQGIGLLGDVRQVMLEELPGRPVGGLTETPLTSLLDRADRRAGLTRPHPCQWRRQVVDTVLPGGGNCCRIEPLRRRSSETSHLPERPHSLVDARAGADRELRDLVRFDVNPLNVPVGAARSAAWSTGRASVPATAPSTWRRCSSTAPMRRWCATGSATRCWRGRAPAPSPSTSVTASRASPIAPADARKGASHASRCGGRG